MTLQLQVESLPNSEPVREACTERASDLAARFPEALRVDVTVQRVGAEHETLVHVTGKDVEVASRARNVDVLGSVAKAFEKTRRQLRKHHDKQIFSHRRETASRAR